MDSVEFAAARASRLVDADDEMRSLVREALAAYRGTNWDEPIVTGAAVLWLEIFSDEAPDSYSDAALREFQKDLRRALAETSKPTDPVAETQVERITKWVGTYTVNNATYQASFAAGRRQKRWVTMADASVRDIHAAAEGQTTSIGGKFDIGGVKLDYPGQPIGPPEVWIECRCLVQGIGRMKGMALTAAGTEGETFEERTGVVIVALPAADDPIVAASSEDVAHMTLVWLGDASDLPGHNVDVADLQANLSSWARRIPGPITEKVSGNANLGADGAHVILVDAGAFAQLRDGMVNEFAEYPEGRPPELDEDENMPITRVFHETEQFPVWLPHVTLGYPDTPAAGEYAGTEITFDRFALWVGDERTEYPFGAGAEEDIEVVTAAAVSEEIPDETSEIEDDEPDIDEDLQIPFHGRAIPIGVPSGDRRQLGIARPDHGITWRELPLPFTYQEKTADGHGDAWTVGKLTEMSVVEEDGAYFLDYAGVFATPNFEPKVSKAIQGIVEGMLRGVSVDVDDVLYSMDDQPADPDGMPPIDIFTRARVSGLTIVGIPAFPEVTLALGECDCPEEVAADAHDELGTEEEMLAASAAFAPGTKDGPGWITDPVPTARIRNYWVHGEGAAKIKWGAPGDFNRCRKQLAKYIKNPDWLAGACANMHKEALGVWPGRETGGAHALLASGAVPAEPFRVVASAAVVENLPRGWFQNPQLDRVTQLQVTPDGHVYGHLAAWGTCHIGIAGVCTTPPYSASNYAYFHTGVVETDGGDVQVGHLTMGIGHAGDYASAAAATAHYDQSDAMVADVVVGEDAYGIWFAGALRGNVDDARRRELRATGSLSGDWRRLAGNLELVGAVAVGVPGFPLPRLRLTASANHQDSLVAAGIVRDTEEFSAAMDLATQRGIVNTVVEEVEARQARREKLALVREREKATLRPARIAAAKRRI